MKNVDKDLQIEQLTNSMMEAIRDGVASDRENRKLKGALDKIRKIIDEALAPPAPKQENSGSDNIWLKNKKNQQDERK